MYTIQKQLRVPVESVGYEVRVIHGLNLGSVGPWTSNRIFVGTNGQCTQIK